MANIYECTNCGRRVIDEERETHVCKPFKGYRMDGATLWVNDGEQWYPLKLHLPTKNQQHFTTPDESTEPKIASLVEYEE